MAEPLKLKQKTETETETGTYLQRQQAFQSLQFTCSYFIYTSKIWGTLLAQSHRGFMTINAVETVEYGGKTMVTK